MTFGVDNDHISLLAEKWSRNENCLVLDKDPGASGIISDHSDEKKKKRGI